MTRPRTPDPAPTSPSAASDPPRRPSVAVPGQKRARHRRWTRLVVLITGVGGAALLAAGALLLPKLLDRPSLEESRIQGVKDFLAGVAHQVELFVQARNRLPVTLAELRDPELPSVYDAEPWDVWRKPIEYRIVDGEPVRFRLRSLGPDARPDTADDVVWPAGAVWRQGP